MHTISKLFISLGAVVLTCVIALVIVSAAGMPGADPYAVVIPDDSSTWDRVLSHPIGALPAEDRQLFQTYLMQARLARAAGIVPGAGAGITVGQAIKEERDWQEKEATRKANATPEPTPYTFPRPTQTATPSAPTGR